MRSASQLPREWMQPLLIWLTSQYKSLGILSGAEILFNRVCPPKPYLQTAFQRNKRGEFRSCPHFTNGG